MFSIGRLPCEHSSERLSEGQLIQHRQYIDNDSIHTARG